MEKERSQEEIQEIRQEIAEKYDIVFPNVVLEPLWWGRRPTTENRVNGRFAIVDQNNGNVFNVCTEAYRPVYHELIIKNVEEAADAMPQFGKPVIDIKLLNDGARMKVNIMFPEVDYQVKAGDILHPTSDIKTSYDLFWKYVVDFGAYRLVCSNGLKVGEVFESFKKRHLTGLDPNILSDTLNSGMLKFDEQTQLWQRWSETKVLDGIYEELWAELPFSKPEREKIENLKAAGTGTLLLPALKSGELDMYEFYNVVTQYATHEVGSEMRKIEIGPKITAVFESYN